MKENKISQEKSSIFQKALSKTKFKIGGSGKMETSLAY